MRGLIQFLFDNPLVLILLGTWLLGLIGKVLSGAGKRATQMAQQQREQAQRRMRQQYEEQQAELEQEAKVDAPPVPRRLTQEEALAEMRRLLQGEPRRGDAAPEADEARERQEAQRQRQREAAAAEEQRQRQREAATAEEQRQRLRDIFVGDARPADRRLGQVEIHVDPHVGEAMQQRRAPASGQVGQKALGSLGGRALAHSAAMLREQHGPVDLHDIKRLLIMREVLGPPLALRQDWGSGQPG